MNFTKGTLQPAQWSFFVIISPLPPTCTGKIFWIFSCCVQHHIFKYSSYGFRMMERLIWCSLRNLEQFRVMSDLNDWGRGARYVDAEFIATRCVHDDQRKQSKCSLPQHTIFCISLQPMRISGRNRQEETEEFRKLHMGLHKLYSSQKKLLGLSDEGRCDGRKLCRGSRRLKTFRRPAAKFEGKEYLEKNMFRWNEDVNPLKPELNPICYLLALLRAHHFLHVSRIRVKLLTFGVLMSYTYGAPILDVSRSQTTTQHSR